MKTITMAIASLLLPTLLYADEFKVDSFCTIECIDTITATQFDSTENNIETTKDIEVVTHTKSKTKKANKVGKGLLRIRLNNENWDLIL